MAERYEIYVWAFVYYRLYFVSFCKLLGALELSCLM